MKILVLGSQGQLGSCLSNQLASSSYQVVYVTRSEIDVADLAKTEAKIAEIGPNILINACAYTAVDNAEKERKAAYLINCLAVTNIANICKDIDCWLIHVSTDYVFDGYSEFPYTEEDKTNPQGVYGYSKLKGELGIKGSGCKYLIIRTAWLYSEYGNNFLKTMLTLGALHNELKIVDDQIGCPTYAPDLAKAIVATLPSLSPGHSSQVYHYAGNSSCSWAEFASIIFEEAVQIKVLSKRPNIVRISSEDYPALAKRPKNSRMDSSKFEAVFEVKSSDLERGVRLSLASLNNSKHQ